MAVEFWSQMEEYLKKGVIKPNPVHIIENGLLGASNGWELLKSGKVSCEKLVIRIKDTVCFT
jgi:hypothetical protein